MPMIAQPPGITRERVLGTQRDDRGKLIKPDEYYINWQNPADENAEKVRIGRTARKDRKWQGFPENGEWPQDFDNHTYAVSWLLEVHRAGVRAAAVPDEVAEPVVVELAAELANVPCPQCSTLIVAALLDDHLAGHAALDEAAASLDTEPSAEHAEPDAGEQATEDWMALLADDPAAEILTPDEMTVAPDELSPTMQGLADTEAGDLEPDADVVLTPFALAVAEQPVAPDPFADLEIQPVPEVTLRQPVLAVVPDARPAEVADDEFAFLDGELSFDGDDLDGDPLANPFPDQEFA